jgi:hypothetical protein
MGGTVYILDTKNMTRSVELKLYAYRKNRDGLIVSFVVHPSDEDFLNGVHIGQVYQAQLEPDFEEEMDEHFLKQEEKKAEGERLRVRAVLLCKDERFQAWLGRVWLPDKEIRGEPAAAVWLRRHLAIQSRSELATNTAAQARFLALEAQYQAETGQAAERRGGQ